MESVIMLRRQLLLATSVFLLMICVQPVLTQQKRLPSVTRAEMIATAKRLSEHRWVCRAPNQRAACVNNYESDWRANDQVAGLAYDWGGMDGPEQFDKKLSQGQAAGSKSRHGITECTAGIDCSGFVSLCWGQPPTHDYSTRSLREIAGRPKYNWYTDMKPGDALNKPGDHIVLFTGYNPDGTVKICEASGGAGRVICKSWPWSRFKDYYPLQYKGVLEE